MPQGTRPWLPCAICQDTSLRNAASSTFPSRMGVMRAGIEPLMLSRVNAMTACRWYRGRNYRGARARGKAGTAMTHTPEVKSRTRMRRGLDFAIWLWS